MFVVCAQESEARPPGASEERRKELHPPVRRADVCPLPEAAGKVLELGRFVPRMQPQDLQQVPRGRGSRGLEVHGLPCLQVGHILESPLPKVQKRILTLELYS